MGKKKRKGFFKGSGGGGGVARTLLADEHPQAVIIEDDMQEAINTDSNGNVKAIRACYGQCDFDSVFRGGGQGITGVMEDVEPKIVGYSRSSEGSGKVTNRHLKDVANTLHTSTGSGGNTDQYVAEPLIAASRGRGDGWKQHLEINESGTSNAITSVDKDNYVMEQDLRMEGGCLVDKDGKRYRIRKLTPRETFRLMDVKDEDIDKIQQAGIAKTNQYKLAGNSIVVSCMYHIFRKLFVEKENENRQLELF